MASPINLTTQPNPIYKVKLTSSVLLPPQKLKKMTNNTVRTFNNLKITCTQHISYNIDPPSTGNELKEEDVKKIDVTLSNGKLCINISLIDGKMYSLNTKKENIILRRLCRPELWKQFGFSRVIAATDDDGRKYNRRYWLYASSETSYSLPLDRDSQLFGYLMELVSKKIQRKSSEIAAIDMVFRIAMRNLLIPRYPLIFSPEYAANLDAISKYIPIISTSFTRIIFGSPTPNFWSTAMGLVDQTSRNINLSSYMGHGTPEKLSQDKTKNIISLGLHAVAKKIKIPVIPLVEQSSSDEKYKKKRTNNIRIDSRSINKGLSSLGKRIHSDNSISAEERQKPKISDTNAAANFEGDLFVENFISSDELDLLTVLDAKSEDLDFIGELFHPSSASKEISPNLLPAESELQMLKKLDEFDDSLRDDVYHVPDIDDMDEFEYFDDSEWAEDELSEWETLSDNSQTFFACTETTQETATQQLQTVRESVDSSCFNFIQKSPGSDFEDIFEDVMLDE
ncbi:1265_t:CDS:2 [Paraglomus brasilianum]|uniref:1265_t:CDS:1 n=1 Tax=Paraglomus brasilianum TaxID=144538 RepID=A0A9N9BZA9_9GLOM|nr:1265_t:CDS:2 [Paraglomus brasilianum]